MAELPEDPFALLGVPRSVDLDAADLEARWIRSSREAHPDHLGDLPPDEQVTALARAAAINDAYRMLKDRWRRAETLCELLEPGVLERTKTLPPDFLMEAMEVAEEVGEVDPSGPAADELARRLESAAEGWFDQVRAALADGRAADAAVLLHKSRYDRKAAADLDAKR